MISLKQITAYLFHGTYHSRILYAFSRDPKAHVLKCLYHVGQDGIRFLAEAPDNAHIELYVDKRTLLESCQVRIAGSVIVQNEFEALLSHGRNLSLISICTMPGSTLYLSAIAA